MIKHLLKFLTPVLPHIIQRGCTIAQTNMRVCAVVEHKSERCRIVGVECADDCVDTQRAPLIDICAVIE